MHNLSPFDLKYSCISFYALCSEQPLCGLLVARASLLTMSKWFVSPAQDARVASNRPVEVTTAVLVRSVRAINTVDQRTDGELLGWAC